MKKARSPFKEATLFVVLSLVIIAGIVTLGITQGRRTQAKNSAMAVHPAVVVHHTLEPGVLTAIKPATTFVVRRAPEFDPVLEQWKMLVSQKGGELFFAVVSTHKPNYKVGTDIQLSSYEYWITDGEREEFLVVKPVPPAK